MNKRNLKLYAVPIMYVLFIFLFGTSIYMIVNTIRNNRFKMNEETEYVSSELLNDNEYIPVVYVEPTIMRPYLIDMVKINKSFYNHNGETEDQENAIIFYENTYIQNSGVSYKFTESFETIAALDGTVIEVTENDLLGKTIKIRHSNDLVSTYQCLSDTNVKTDDTVMRGQVIGKSGTCAIYSKDYNLHFELSYQGKNIDPEQSYNKTENEL